MHILSWNVNGLRTSRIVGNRASRLKREIASVTSSPVDILMLQEHKLAHPYGHLLGSGSRTYWSPSIGDSGHNCGVCISVSSAFVASVCQHDILVPGRAMYVIVRITDARIGFLSIMSIMPRLMLELGRLSGAFWWTPSVLFFLRLIHGLLEETSTTLSLPTRTTRLRLPLC